MTRTCGTLSTTARNSFFRLGPVLPDATIETREELSVASLLSLIALVRDTGAPRSLLFARIDWAKLQGVAKPTWGVPAPRTARETYTRSARREQRRRQLARRGGIAGLTRMLRNS